MLRVYFSPETFPTSDEAEADAIARATVDFPGRTITVHCTMFWFTWDFRWEWLVELAIAE